jgi:hypothetical protein
MKLSASKKDAICSDKIHRTSTVSANALCVAIAGLTWTPATERYYLSQDVTGLPTRSGTGSHSGAARTTDAHEAAASSAGPRTCGHTDGTDAGICTCANGFDEATMTCNIDLSIHGDRVAREQHQW